MSLTLDSSNKEGGDTPIADLLRATMAQELLIDRIHTLGLEYQAKAISPERFAERVYGLLVEYERQGKCHLP